MAQLDTAVATWKSKITVDDTVDFGGDLAATGSSPASWSSGAQSIMRMAALAPTDYLELDFTFDAKTAGHGIGVGLAPGYVAPSSPGSAGIVSSIWWDTDGALKAFEGGSLRNSVPGIALPMSCRIIYNAGVLTWRRNSGSDLLMFTSARTVNEIVAEMIVGFQVVVFFHNTSGKLHVTLKGGDASAPEVALSGAGTGRLGAPTFTPKGMDMSSYNLGFFRHFEAIGFPPPNPNPRPTEGKIWPRNK